MKILSGVYEKDSGGIIIRGQPIADLTPHIAQDLRIITIKQARIEYLTLVLQKTFLLVMNPF